MPPTLAMFKSRVRQVYGLDSRTPFEIWLHPYARGAAPGSRLAAPVLGLLDLVLPLEIRVGGSAR